MFVDGTKQSTNLIFYKILPVILVSSYLTDVQVLIILVSLVLMSFDLMLWKWCETSWLTAENDAWLAEHVCWGDLATAAPPLDRYCTLALNAQDGGTHAGDI